MDISRLPLHHEYTHLPLDAIVGGLEFDPTTQKNTLVLMKRKLFIPLLSILLTSPLSYNVIILDEKSLDSTCGIRMFWCYLRYRLDKLLK